MYHSKSVVSTDNHAKTPTRKTLVSSARARVGVTSVSMYAYNPAAVSCFDSRIVTGQSADFGGAVA